MKKYLYFIVSLFFLSFISCSSGEENENEYEETAADAAIEQKFLGTSWKYVKRIFVRNGQMNDLLLGQACEGDGYFRL